MFELRETFITIEHNHEYLFLCLRLLLLVISHF